ATRRRGRASLAPRGGLLRAARHQVELAKIFADAETRGVRRSARPDRRALTRRPRLDLRSSARAAASALERVAGLEGAGVKTAPEPLRALLRSAVGEGLRHHLAARGLLQAVVADR